MQWENQRILITGATGGIGHYLVQTLAAKGSYLLLCGRQPKPLEELGKSLPKQNYQLLCADLTESADLRYVASAAQEQGVTMVIHMAGANQLSLLDQSTPDALERNLQLNLLAPMQLTQMLLPHLKAQPQSTLVFVGSILGSIGYPGSTAYCASKFGLRGFSEALSRELADTQIQVRYFAPRATDTNMNTNAMREMNQALGVAMDSPQRVAEQLIKMLDSTHRRRYLGMPERLFVKINGLFPTIVDSAIIKQLPIIKRYTNPLP